MTTIHVKGSIIDDSQAWAYDWLRIPYTAAGRFKEQLAAAEDDVVIEINSPGGYVAPAAEIYDAIRSHEGGIECRVVGQAASAASIIACAAKSTITPMGTLFLHNCISSAAGNHNVMRQAMKTMESVDENIMEAYRAKTGMSDAEIYALMEENTTLNARQAVELGFVDEVAEYPSEVPASASAATGIAASANGFVDLMAMGEDRLAAMRELYEQSMRGTTGGGEEMKNENIEEAGTVENDAEPIEGGSSAEPETDDEPTAAETDAGAAEDGQADDGSADAEGETDAEGGAGPDGEAAVSDYDAGVLAERARVAAIMDIAANVPDSMVRAALFDNPISAEQLALAAIKAEDETRTGYMGKARRDAKDSGSSNVAATVAGKDDADDIKTLAAKVSGRFGN